MHPPLHRKKPTCAAWCLGQGIGQSQFLSGCTGCVKQCAFCKAAWMRGVECSSGLAGSLPQSACFGGNARPASTWHRRNCLNRILARSWRKMRRLRLSRDAAQLATLLRFHRPMCTGIVLDRHHCCHGCNPLLWLLQHALSSSCIADGSTRLK